jgi:hypothetical protein
MPNKTIDHSSIEFCRACGDEITLHDVTKQEIQSKIAAVDANGGLCDFCEQGSTLLAKRVDYEMVLRLGPTPKRHLVASVSEPPNASYVVVTLWDGRSAKIFEDGVRHPTLTDEIDYVFTTEFPDLQNVKRPGYPSQ